MPLSDPFCAAARKARRGAHCSQNDHTHQLNGHFASLVMPHSEGPARRGAHSQNDHTHQLNAHSASFVMARGGAGGGGQTRIRPDHPSAKRDGQEGWESESERETRDRDRDVNDAMFGLLVVPCQPGATIHTPAGTGGWRPRGRRVEKSRLIINSNL